MSNTSTAASPEIKKTAAPAPTQSLAAFRRSQTFLARLPDPRVFKLRLFTVLAVLVIFFVAVPAMNAAGVVPDYKVNLLGKYLTFGLVALGIDLIWGYTGILSLCQALFFCLGGYAMAMHLSLKEGGGDVRPEYNNIPQFMFFNNVHDLPAFWRPFASMPFTLFVVVALPAIVAGVFGFFIFRSRVRGVYFSIVTQAAAWGAWLLISRNEMLLGGTNGLTNFNKAFTTDRHHIVTLYFLTLFCVTAAYFLCRYLTRSKLGRVLVATRDKEPRLYFAGYRPYAFKVFAFVVAAILAAVGGMLYAPQVGIITPQNMDVPTSIDMVILVAVGGRGRLWGALFGALLVSYIKSAITSDMASAWLFFQGLIFVCVVLFFPDGIVGVWDSLEKQVKNGDTRSATATFITVAGIALFVLAEALGLQPTILAKPAAITFGLPPKYFVLIALIAVSVVRYVIVQRQLKLAAGQRGLPVAAAARA